MVVNQEADQAYAKAKDVIDNVPLSRVKREKCDDVLARLDKLMEFTKL